MKRIKLILLMFVFYCINCSENTFSNSYTNEDLEKSYTFEQLNVPKIITNCEDIYKWKNSSSWEFVKSKNSIRLNASIHEKWFRFHFKNASIEEKEWYLILKWTALDFAEFCSPVHERGLETQFSGIEIPHEKWTIHTIFPTFRFWLEPKSEEIFYLRIKSENTLSIPIKVILHNTFLGEVRKITAINFLFIGFALFYIIYNFFHFFESRDSLYLYNNIFLISLSLTVLSRFGLAFEILWNNSSVWQKMSTNFFLGITTFGALEFARRFLNVHKFYRRMDYAYKILSTTGLLFSIAALLSVPRIYMAQFFAVFFIILVSFIIISSVRVLIQKKFKPAKWFLAAIPYFFFTAILNVFFHLDLWDYNRYWIYAFMFFLPISFIFISLSLHEKMRDLRNETEKHKSEIQILLERLKSFTEEKPSYSKTQLNGIDIEKKIIKLIDLMENDKVFYDEKLNLESLAEKLSLSKHQLSEILNRVLKTNFREFIQDYRIQEAAALLEKRNDLNVLGIAYEVGFQSKSTFNTLFKKKTGFTPMEYKMQKEKIPPIE